MRHLTGSFWVRFWPGNILDIFYKVENSHFFDHLPLVHAMHADTPRQNARQARHLALISKYTTDIQHVAGTHNIVADTLSRVGYRLMLYFSMHNR